MHTRFDSISPGNISVRTLSSGPNAGWAYISAPFTTYQLVTDVSDAWKHGSAWYNLQHGGPTGLVDAAGVPTHYCSKAEISQLFQPALEHEGVKSGSIVSHVEIFRRWFANNAAQDTIEKAVQWVPDLNGYDPARAIIGFEISNIESDALADPDQVHTNVPPPAKPGLVQPAVFPCQPRYFP